MHTNTHQITNMKRQARGRQLGLEVMKLDLFLGLVALLPHKHTAARWPSANHEASARVLTLDLLASFLNCKQGQSLLEPQAVALCDSSWSGLLGTAFLFAAVFLAVLAARCLLGRLPLNGRRDRCCSPCPWSLESWASDPGGLPLAQGRVCAPLCLSLENPVDHTGAKHTRGLCSLWYLATRCPLWQIHFSLVCAPN